MKKLNKIRLFSKETMEVWSEMRLIRWKGRVQNHLDGILKEHKNKTSATWDINKFKEYIKLMNKILETNDYTSNTKNITTEDISG